MSILIKHVLLDGKRTDIYVEGNEIESIGNGGKKDVVVDGRGKAAVPGLINAHTHAAMTLLRGLADDMNLQEWLEKNIWPIEAKMTEDDVFWGSKLACLEMIKSGTTCFNDMYWHLGGTYKATHEMGIRGVLSSVLIDRFTPEKGNELRRTVEREVREYGKSPLVRISIGPHAIYTVTEETLRWTKEFSDKNDLLVHFHLSETKKEVDDCVKEHGKRPVEYLNDIGFLGENLVCAHCVWLTQHEMQLLAENRVKVAHCPTSNMKLSVGGALDYRGLRNAGVTVSLGTDGCSSNNSLDMFESMKFAALLAKMSYNDPTLLSAPEAFRMATQDAAWAMKLNAGEIREGRLADIVLIDLKKPGLTPMHNLTSNLVYSAHGDCVDTVICDGKVIMEDGRVRGEEEIVEKAGMVAADLKVRK